MKRYCLYAKNPRTQALFTIDNSFKNKAKMYDRINELLATGNDIKIEQNL